MPKLKGGQDLQKDFIPPVLKPDPWSGTWGRMNPTPQSVHALRLCKTTSSSLEESYSYPYRSLSSWRWRRDLQEEELKIEAGPDTITIRGKNLDRLVDALNMGGLEFVRESPIGAASCVESTIIIQSLIVEKSETNTTSTIDRL